MRRIHDQLDLPVLADIATEAEAMQAIAAGADAVATTLAGYTPASAGLVGAAWDLLATLVAKSPVPVILEGRIETPADFRRALEHGRLRRRRRNGDHPAGEHHRKICRSLSAPVKSFRASPSHPCRLPQDR